MIDGFDGTASGCHIVACSVSAAGASLTVDGLATDGHRWPQDAAALWNCIESAKIWPKLGQTMIGLGWTSQITSPTPTSEGVGGGPSVCATSCHGEKERLTTWCETSQGVRGQWLKNCIEIARHSTDQQLFQQCHCWQVFHTVINPYRRPPKCSFHVPYIHLLRAAKYL